MKEQIEAKEQELYLEAVTALLECARGKREFTPLTRSLLAAMGVYVRRKAAENNTNALTYRIIKDFSQDREELRKFIASAIPVAVGKETKKLEEVKAVKD
jgi:hypothetical protein